MTTSKESEIIWYGPLLVLSPFIAAGLGMLLFLVFTVGYEVIGGKRLLTDLESQAWIGRCVQENKGQFVAVGGEQSYCESKVPMYIKTTEEVDLRTGEIVSKSR